MVIESKGSSVMLHRSLSGAPEPDFDAMVRLAMRSQLQDTLNQQQVSIQDALRWMWRGTVVLLVMRTVQTEKHFHHPVSDGDYKEINGNSLIIMGNVFKTGRWHDFHVRTHR